MLLKRGKGVPSSQSACSLFTPPLPTPPPIPDLQPHLSPTATPTPACRSYEGVRELARRSAAERGPFQLAALEGSPHKGYCGSIPCEFWHPGHTCVSHIPAYWPGAYLRALPV